MQRLIRAQFARFIFVGIINTSFSYIIYAGLIWFGLHFSLANLFAYGLGMIFAFRAHGALVFGNREWKRMLPFVLCGIFIYLVNILLIALFVHFGFSTYVAGALALAPVAVLSYLTQRFVVFAPSDSRRTARSNEATDSCEPVASAKSTAHR